MSVLAGLCSGTHAGAVAVYLFFKEGYAIALIPHGANSRKALSEDINTAGRTAASFPISLYSTMDINTSLIQIHTHCQGQPIHVALYNAGYSIQNSLLQYHPRGHPSLDANECQRRIHMLKEHHMGIPIQQSLGG
ncbi:hypothetical protein ARMSODRAFT_1020157 [Armillaria solidipes]|uniref:Uncharacterized protein n=1 Tax=Armillaria solidipes TaxID=1076256 RepID=A0A2H3BMD6_9AGAR|nr:hypothetical protein ARMSODRAFT_1020157 [Armillaria solidipes]